MKRRAGFTMAELAIVIAVIGVILAAVFLFFHSGSTAARRITEATAAQTDARVVANQLDGLLQTAGFTTVAPPGEWHPILRAEPETMTFVANSTRPELFGPEDTITVSAAENGSISVVDADGNPLASNSALAEFDLAYFDAGGGELSAEELATQAGRDLIRSIAYRVHSTTGGGDAVMAGTVTPPNLMLSGAAAGNLPGGLGNGGSRNTHFFDENWENSSTLFNQDYIEATIGWDPIRWETFEAASSWSSLWYVNRSDPAGRGQRLLTPTAQEGQYVMALDRSGPGAFVKTAGVWNVDMAEFAAGGVSLRLHFWWRHTNEGWNAEDGVFFPTYQNAIESPIFSQNFESFSNDGNSRNTWTYWTDTYGNIVVTNLYPYGANNKYLNMDSRRDGYASHNRAMWTMNLSPYSALTNLELKMYVCSRGEEYNSGPTGDFIGLAGAGGITGTPVWYQNLVLGPAGTWTPVTIDLDAVVPAGYDWSNFRILLAQYDNDRTVSSTGNDGISFDNISVSSVQLADTLFTQKLRSTPAAWASNTWYEQFVDLDSAAVVHGRPFANPFPIAWVEYGNDAMPNDGIQVDNITIEQEGRWIIPGWTDAPVPGYTVNQWVPSQHDHYAIPNTYWCWSVNEGGPYTATPTRAYIESPSYSLAAYAPGTRLSFAFFHKYAWAAGDGCNVKIWNSNTGTWELVVPYWGYYTAAVPALDNEPGWTGVSPGSNWQFCVFDISDYAGMTVKFRFTYGTQGSGSMDGWNVDYTRFRVGPDWPQIIWYYPSSEFADWFGWSTPPGVGDPAAAAYGTRSAGNDMATWSPWDTYYENNLHNALISPPVEFNDAAAPYYYIQFMNCIRTQLGSDTGYLEAAPFATTIADTAWRLLGSWSGSSANWWMTRIYMNPHLNYWHSLVPPRCTDNTVVFRWRMWANASLPDYGGWNVDSIKAFSSSVYLPPITAPLNNAGGSPVVFFAPEEIPEDQTAPTVPEAVLPVRSLDDPRRTVSR